MSPDLVFQTEDARTTGRTSARSQRVEVLPHAERRRSWTVEQKREIVGESLGPDLTPTEVARKYGISTGQLYTWRQQLVSLPGAVVTHVPPRFAPVELTSPPTSEPTPAELPALVSPSSPLRPEGLIEIVLSGGVLLRVDAHVDAGALRRILGVLESR